MNSQRETSLFSIPMAVKAKTKTAKKKRAPKATAAATSRKAAPKSSAKRGGIVQASVDSILGSNHVFSPTTDLSKIKPEWRKFYRNLMELRERLVQQMGGLAKESAEQIDGYSLHMADCGTDNFDRDFALSLLSSDQDALYEIDEALKRIIKGTYGVCALTGKSIPKARLEAIPWARFTVQAQAQLEKDGALRQRRLGSLGTIESGGVVEIEDDGDDDDRPTTAKEKE